MSNNQLAQVVIRIGLGITMFMHGLVRIPKLNAFVAKTEAGFANTLLPPLLTKAFLYTLPFIELIIGLLILIGGQFWQVGLPGRWRTYRCSFIWYHAERGLVRCWQSTDLRHCVLPRAARAGFAGPEPFAVNIIPFPDDSKARQQPNQPGTFWIQGYQCRDRHEVLLDSRMGRSHAIG